MLGAGGHPGPWASQSCSWQCLLLTFPCSHALACPSPPAARGAGEQAMGQGGVLTGIALCWGGTAELAVPQEES